MGISRDQFAGQTDTTLIKILQFLAENVDQAFTDKEIGERVGVDPKKLFLTLLDLKAMGVVIGKSIGTSYYYILSDDTAMKIKSGGIDLPALLEELQQQGGYQVAEDATRYIG